MSMDYGVHPLDPDNQDFHAWLESEGVDIPNIKGRFPTLDELLSVLHTFNGLAVNTEIDEVISVTLGNPEEPGFAQMLGNRTAEGYYDFFFSGQRSTDAVMLAILKKLSAFCGPFVLRESYGATPVLVMQDTDVDAALQDWRGRFRKKYPGQTVSCINSIPRNQNLA